MTEQSFTFDGRPVAFRSGQSLGAALTAAGVRSWRTTRADGRPRGLFCGIGVCFDCLLVVDGRPNERACLQPAAAGMQVESQEGTGHGHLEV
ncbi:(2Fe-2S)-binding protein [Blastococcus mobilis]|uniref:2Fe-2S iron-sulfur cluster binding domain-containing protein n=1 Tax=Blastococcus mobilis TaxID=1938746 RepID=A0A238Y514_9ACTN|nr:(2Fe-2S)-binding protein [Blastococcus mobilis]SNR65664.1 2Fe-2S iron-sulfur cluster binding domain-containing protein [Blastococcus mobilis]